MLPSKWWANPSPDRADGDPGARRTMSEKRCLPFAYDKDPKVETVLPSKKSEGFAIAP